MRTLANSEWARQHYNLAHWSDWDWETWLGCALAQNACRKGFTILHKRANELFRELAVAHVDGSFGRLLAKLARIDILEKLGTVIDHWLPEPKVVHAYPDARFHASRRAAAHPK